MTISIQLPSDVENRLDQLASLTGRSKNFYVQEAIVECLDDLEDLYLAQHELEEIRAGRSKTTPLAEVMKHYGMEN